MIPYNQKEIQKISFNDNEVYCFSNHSNLDPNTIKSFGNEWNKFSSFSDDEIKSIGDEYFDIVDPSIINSESIVLDVGCGSGRWSKYLSPKVKSIEAIDPSDAIISASILLKQNKNVRITKAYSDNLPFDDKSFDFVFSLGVLHHIPDTQKALNDIVKKAKLGGHVLIYLYYNLDNRGVFYKIIFKLSTVVRYIVSKLPKKIKHIVCEFLAYTVYAPLIYLAKFIRFIIPKFNIHQKLPLSYYMDKSFHVVRNDVLDRFGTPLEQRFSKKEISKMMINSGLTDILFSNNAPYWHAIGKREK